MVAPLIRGPFGLRSHQSIRQHSARLEGKAKRQPIRTEVLFRWRLLLRSSPAFAFNSLNGFQCTDALTICQSPVWDHDM
jgi:hypothetical protein